MCLKIPNVFSVTQLVNTGVPLPIYKGRPFSRAVILEGLLEGYMIGITSPRQDKYLVLTLSLIHI